MKEKATNISYYIDIELLESLDEYVKAERKRRSPERVNRSEIMSKFVKEGLDRHVPNRKIKRILAKKNGE